MCSPALGLGDFISPGEEHVEILEYAEKLAAGIVITLLHESVPGFKQHRGEEPNLFSCVVMPDTHSFSNGSPLSRDSRGSPRGNGAKVPLVVPGTRAQPRIP